MEGNFLNSDRLEDDGDHEGIVVYHTGYDAFLYFRYELTWHVTKAVCFSRVDNLIDCLSNVVDIPSKKIDKEIVDWCLNHMNDLELVPAIVDMRNDCETHGSIKKIDYSKAEGLCLLVEQRMNDG